MTLGTIRGAIAITVTARVIQAFNDIQRSTQHDDIGEVIAEAEN